MYKSEKYGVRTIFGAGGPMVGRLACSLLLSSRPAPPPLLGSIRVCGGSWEGLVQVVVWAHPLPRSFSGLFFLPSCSLSRPGLAAVTTGSSCTSLGSPSSLGSSSGGGGLLPRPGLRSLLSQPAGRRELGVAATPPRPDNFNDPI